jgi:hypothetical protein
MSIAPPAPFPAIPNVDKLTLQQAALWLFQWFVAQGVKENGVNNRGAWVDYFNARVGLPVPTDPREPGYPWCTSSAFCLFEEAARQKGLDNPFPKTGKAVEVYNRAEPICRVSNPRAGSIIILDHGKAWASELGTGARLTDSGHCCMANAAVAGDLSGNTNGGGSREGDRFFEHPWPDGGDAAAVHGGVIVGILDFDEAPQPPSAHAA